MPAKTTTQSEAVHNPYGYSEMDWAAQLDPAYAAARAEDRRLSVGEEGTLAVKVKELSLSRLNHRLPRSQSYPEVVQSTTISACPRRAYASPCHSPSPPTGPARPSCGGRIRRPWQRG